MRKKLRTGILLFLLSLLFTIPAYAGETDEWLDGWDYEIQGDLIYLKGYSGDDTDLDIYGKAVVDGNSYRTAVFYDRSSRKSSFSGNTEITSLSFHPVDGQKVKGTYNNEMVSTFEGMSSLESINFGDGYDSSGSTAFSAAFRRCASLTEVDLENLDFSAATNYNSMFSGCKSLTNIDVSALDFSSVNNMSYMFEGCSSLESLDFSGQTWPSIGAVGSAFFSNCDSLSEIIIDENVNINTQGFGIGSVKNPVKVKVVGKMSESFRKNVYSQFRKAKRYMTAIDVSAGITLTGDDTYDCLSYGLTLSDGTSEKIQDNDGSDSIYFDGTDHSLFIYEPGEYTLTLVQGVRGIDPDTGKETVQALEETEDGFSCGNSIITKTIRVSRNDDGSVIVEEI